MSRPLVLTGPHGRIEVSGDALESLVAVAVGRVEGATLARGRRGVELEPREGAVHAQVALTVAAGLVLPDVGEAAQRAAEEALRRTTGVRVQVDVAVVGVDA